jgi:hypothetical protein
MTWEWFFSLNGEQLWHCNRLSAVTEKWLTYYNEFSSLSIPEDDSIISILRLSLVRHWVSEDDCRTRKSDKFCNFDNFDKSGKLSKIAARITRAIQDREDREEKKEKKEKEKEKEKEKVIVSDVKEKNFYIKEMRREIAQEKSLVQKGEKKKMRNRPGLEKLKSKYLKEVKMARLKEFDEDQ